MAAQRDRVIALIRKRAGVQLTAPRTPMPRQLHPETIQLDYFNQILPVVEATRRLIARELFSVLPNYIDASARERERSDATTDGGLNDRFHRLMRQAGEIVRPRELEILARAVAQRTSTFQKDQLNKQARAALGVDLGMIEPVVQAQIGGFVTDNVALIRSIPTQYVAAVEKDVLAAVRHGTRWENLAPDIEARYGVTENRARLIARDQVGKFYGALNQKRQEAMGVTGYTWRTSRDGRVRDEHEDREGEHFEWSDPPDDGHPGDPVNCRCNAEPDFSAIVEGLSASP